MTDAARLLGEDLARATGPGPEAGGTVSAEVIDVTDLGVNVMVSGALVLDVPCPDSYRGRKRGDWVAIRMGARPVVLWRLGPDPADDPAQMPTVRAVTWGTAVPSGTGWQEATTPWVRDVGDGQVELYYQVGTVAEPSPTAPATKAVSIAATSSGSWRNGRLDDYRDYPFQGDWTGGGNLRGGWFYGTKIASACAGKTVSKMTVSFSRRRGAGRNAQVPMHLYLHDHTSPPSSLDLDEGPEELLRLSVGAKGTATIPAAWRSLLAAGTRRGLAIYARGSRDYASFTGGTIRIEFS